MNVASVNTCNYENCEGSAKAKGFCEKHYNRQRLYGRLENIRRQKGTFTISSHGYKKITKNGEQVYSHIVRAEEALGKSLPKGAVVSFVGSKNDNTKKQTIVICEDKAYSHNIKRREEALEVTGNPRMRRCNKCKEWDLPQNMYCYRADAKTGYRFKHQVELGVCFSAPIPAHKIKMQNGGKRRHFHWLDYEELLKDVDNKMV
jgi:uncharacterized protein YbaA (DUF1428 family)